MKTETPIKISLTVVLAFVSFYLISCNSTESGDKNEPVQKLTTIKFGKTVLNFGSVPVDSSRYDTIIISSEWTSFSSIKVSAQLTGSSFSIIEGSGTKTLAANESYRVIVRFKPTSIDSFSGTLSFSHNASDQIGLSEVAVLGKGVSASLPSTPTLLSPLAASTGVFSNPTDFSWNKSAYAESYRLQISSSASFSVILGDFSPIPDTLKSVAGTNLNTTYYWRVSATNSNGTSPFSAIRSFTTGPRPGESWSTRFSSATENLSRVAWCPERSMFIAVGSSGTLITSTNGGSNWAQRDPGTLASLKGVVCAGSKILAVGAGTITSSTNVNDWQAINIGTFSLNGVDWSGSNFVAVGDSGLILTSPDGATWTQRSSGTSNYLTSVRWNGFEFIAVGDDGIVLRSSSGTTWNATFTYQYPLLDVIYVNSLYWIVGPYYIWYWNGGSSGLSWNQAVVSDRDFRSIAWSGSRYVVVGNQGSIYSASGGTVWTLRDSSTTAQLNSVAWSGSTFVVVGNQGKILSSP